ncbi:hypothetical protein E2562_017144 [Oryza meyeriana var. granulata]|uniref:Amine oxidase n=1 Tax=Oryza meyeriana var. granulata TaxID=110450 RepID=A0A6G1EM53_9ORYZ|nr:hypothetical protein E2562_017144 [Oryza meyeriana var. granulata]
MEITVVRAATCASLFVPARLLYFHYVGLNKPDKLDVLSYAYGAGATATSSPNPILPCHSFVIARTGGKSHEFIVDIANNTSSTVASVISHAVHCDPGFQCSRTRIRSPPWLDTSNIGCRVLSKGWIGSSKLAYHGARVVKINKFNATANIYTRPLEGMVMVVDLDQMAIIGYNDRVVHPVPKAEGIDYRVDKVGPLFTGPAAPPGVVVQPVGRGFNST